LQRFFDNSFIYAFMLLYCNYMESSLSSSSSSSSLSMQSQRLKFSFVWVCNSIIPRYLEEKWRSCWTTYNCTFGARKPQNIASIWAAWIFYENIILWIKASVIYTIKLEAYLKGRSKQRRIIHVISE